MSYEVVYIEMNINRVSLKRDDGTLFVAEARRFAYDNVCIGDNVQILYGEFYKEEEKNVK